MKYGSPEYVAQQERFAANVAHNRARIAQVATEQAPDPSQQIAAVEPEVRTPRATSSSIKRRVNARRK